MKKYLVQFETTVQVSEDSWRVIRPSLEVDDSMSLCDILRWVESKNNTRLPHVIEIREMERLPKP